MFCPKCGAQVRDGSSFCSGCGAPLQKESAPTPPAPSPHAKNHRVLILAVVVAIVLVVGGGATAFALFNANKPGIEGKWTTTATINNEGQTYDFGDVSLVVHDSKFELTVARMGYVGSLLGLSEGESVKLEGTCTLESQSDDLVYAIELTDIPSNLYEMLGDESQTQEELINEFNKFGVKLHVPATGTKEAFPRGKWGVSFDDPSWSLALVELSPDDDSGQSGQIFYGIGNGNMDSVYASIWCGTWKASGKNVTFEIGESHDSAMIVEVSYRP